MKLWNYLRQNKQHWSVFAAARGRWGCRTHKTSVQAKREKTKDISREVFEQRVLFMLRVSCLKLEIKMLWGENRGKWKRPAAAGSWPRTPLAWATSALPLSYDSRTTTNPHNPLYILHRWYWMPQLHTWQPLSMCRQNSVRDRPENSLRQERTHAEWFFSL